MNEALGSLTKPVEQSPPFAYRCALCDQMQMATRTRMPVWLQTWHDACMSQERMVQEVSLTCPRCIQKLEAQL